MDDVGDARYRETQRIATNAFSIMVCSNPRLTEAMKSQPSGRKIEVWTWRLRI